MSTPSSNATSPSTSSRFAPSPSIGSAMGRSGSSRSLFRDSTRMPTTRSRQNTLSGIDDLVRNLGSDYQEIQKRTLTKWVNAQLEQEGDHIDHIETDLKDGKRLLKLLSVVSKEPAPKPERMNMRIHQLANVAQALAFLEKQVGPETMPDIGNEAIVNGDPKKTVALVFFIMLKYQIQLIMTEHGEDYWTSLSALSERKRDGLPCVSELQQPNAVLGTPTDTATPLDVPQRLTPSLPSNNSLNSVSLAHTRKLGSSNSISEKHSSTATEAKTALLYWVRIQLEDYIAANIIPSVQDFSRSWRTGVAFCLLIHRHDPYLIPDLFTAHIKGDMTLTETWLQLLKLAFDLADTQLGIRPYLDPTDLIDVDYPHEPSVMMYVSEFYKVMSRTQRDESESSKRERAAKRRANIAFAAGDEDMAPVVVDVSPHFMEDLKEEDEEDEPEGAEEEKDEPRSKLATYHDKQPPIDTLKTLEAPVPIPTFSARRTLRKKMHRHSSLGEEDKARIKTDLSNKLMMQLTGHLPRGVHPVLDQLLKAHEEIMAFIRTNTSQMDDIPEDFTSSSEVTDHIEWLEELEIQANDKGDDLDMAKEARDVLTTPPEKADESLIRLTDLQRTQVEKLYSMLLKQWCEFLDMMQATKTDLQHVEADLASLESGILEYQNEAHKLQAEMATIERWLVQELPVNRRYEESVHPLDGTRAIVREYKEDAEKAEAQFEAFDTGSWRKFRRFITHFPTKVLQSVSARQQQLEGQRDQLYRETMATKQAYIRFEKGVLLATLSGSIFKELDEVQKLMDNDNYTTDGAIQDLEKRISQIRTQIYHAREECDLALEDERCSERLLQVEERYDKVRHWVDQVREWFAEAERIRRWIARRIALIHERNEQNVFDPLSQDTPARGNVPELVEEHEKLTREIDRFNKDDMARLRDHVRKLTNMEDRNRELSPADTSTIEITLTTVTMLNQLLQLLSERSLMVEMLKLRIQWEEKIGDATQWIANTDHELDTFIHDGARWCDGDGVDDLSIRSSAHTGKRKSAALGIVINTLTDLEERIASFDSGTYSETLDAYQDLEDLVKNTNDSKTLDGQNDDANKEIDMSLDSNALNTVLPDYLELRQSLFEKSFESTMNQSHFSRKVVEQHLSVADLVEKFLRLRSEGERLQEEIIMPTIDDSPDLGDEDSFADRIQKFKEGSDTLIMQAVKSVVYPVVQDPEDKNYEDNEKSNEAIRASVDRYAMSLAIVAERLEDALARHRQSLSLQQRATLAHEDMIRMTEWMEERVRTLEKTSPDLDDEEYLMSLDSESMSHLHRERDGIAQRLQQLKAGDIAKLMERVRLIEEEIGASNDVSVDQSMLFNGIEQLEHSVESLKDFLTRRASELNLLEKSTSWKAELESNTEKMTSAASQLWGFVESQVEEINNAEDMDSNGDTIHIAKAEETLKSLQASVQVVEETMERAKAFCADLFQAYVSVDIDTPVFVNAEQSEHAQKVQELQSLLGYASAIYEQYKAIRHVILLAREAKSNGTMLRDEYTRRSSLGDEGDHNDTTPSVKIESNLEDQRKAFKTRVEDCQEACKQIPYPALGQWLRQSPQKLDSKDKLVPLVKQILEELSTLHDAVEKARQHYESSCKVNTLAAQYTKEADELYQWVEKRIQLVKECHIDVTTEIFHATENDIKDMQQRHKRIADDVKRFKEESFKVLQTGITEIEGQREAQASLELPSLAKVADGLAELDAIVASDAIIFEIAFARARWQQAVDTGMAKLQEMNEYVRQFVTTKNSWMVQDEVSDKQMLQITSDLDDISLMQQRFDQREMQNIQTAYSDMAQHFARHDQQMPEPAEARMDTVRKSLTRFQNNVSTRFRELDLLKQRLAWQVETPQVIADIASQRRELEAFVADTRWGPNITAQEDDEARLRLLWSEKSDRLSQSQEQTKKLRASLTELQYRVKEQSTLSIVPETLVKKVEDMDTEEERMKRDLAFANDIITQRCKMSAFVMQTSQLEQSADMIRDEFLEQKTANLEANADRLELFKKGVAEVRTSLLLHVPLPVRVDKDVPMQVRVRDETVNAVIRDAMDVRAQRLEELCSSLESLLASKERVSRQQVIIDAYRGHAHRCQSWVASHQNILRQHAQTMTQPTSDQDSEEALEQQLVQFRNAVSIAESIQVAMKANDNVSTLLVEAFKKCQSVTEDEEANESNGIEKELQEDWQAMSSMHNKILEQWQSLLNESEKTATALSAALIPLEFKSRVKNLLTAFRNLEKEINDTHPDSVTDDQILLWQKRIDHLESKNYHSLQAESAELLQSDCDLHAIPPELDEGADTILRIRALLTQLYDRVNMNRLCKTHAENVAIAQGMIDRARGALAEIQETYSVVSGDRTVQHHSLITAHREFKSQLSDCKETYDDLCAYREFIRLHGDLGPVNTAQENVEKAWQVLQTEAATLVTFVSRAAKWVELYDALEKHGDDLEKLKQDMAGVPRPLKKSAIESMEKKMNRGLSSLQDLEAKCDSKDKENADLFSQALGQVNGLAESIRSDLEGLKTQLEKALLSDLFTNEAARLRSLCEEQLRFIRQQASANPDVAGKRAESIHHIVQTYNAALTTIRSVYAKCKEELDGKLNKQATRLLRTMHYPQTQIDSVLRPLEKVLGELGGAIKNEEDYLAALKSTAKHARLESDLTRSLGELRSMVGRCSKGSASMVRSRCGGMPLPEILQDFSRRFDAIEQTLKTFCALGNNIKTNTPRNIGVSRVTVITKSIDKRQDAIRKGWLELRASAQETRVRLEELKKRQTVAQRLSEALQSVNILKDRVNALQLSGKSVAMEEDELQEIQREMDVTLTEKARQIDTLLASISDNDGHFKKQRDQLTTVTDELRHLMQVRQAQAHTEGNIALFFGIIERLDDQLLQMTSAIDKAAPHHARVVNDRFQKADLQLLLRELVTTYKETEPKVGDLLTQARSEAQKQFLDDNERVAKRLQKTADRWTKIQAAASSRERDLQTCISQLNHEFFTKLAKAKSTPRMQSTDRKTRRASFQTPRSTLPQPVKPLSGAPRRGSFKATTAAVDNRKRSRTPSSTYSFPRAPVSTYVPDPKNELDVHLGRVVNESAYRMKIKMVPGEVGKYWFGEDHPRLMYCRILPSKLVMLRVGGGWVELSKFLKDHGRNDVSSNRSDTSDATTEGEDASTLSGRVAATRGRSGSVASNASSLHPSQSARSQLSTRSRSPAPPSGYVEDGKFIRVDEDGNQFAMKMTKANDSAKMPPRRYSRAE